MDQWLGQKERRRSSSYKVFLGDYRGMAQKPVFRRTLDKYGGTEKVLFSDIVVKVNAKNKMQERMIVITDAAIYNLEPSTLRVRRRILLSELDRVSLSTFSDNFFVLHVPSEYDYLLISRRKVEIVSQLMSAYENSLHKPLQITIAPTFEYKIDPQTVRVIRFTRTDKGVSTAVFAHH